MSKLQLIYPVNSVSVSQGFGENGVNYADPKYGGIIGHNGIDFRAQHGTPVYATHDGVCYPQIDSAGGNGVVIRTHKTFDYNNEQVYFKTIYWHFVDAYAVVKTGQVVETGDLIGYADNTGASTGDHLHFGLKPQAYNESDFAFYNVEQKNGYLGSINPTPYFDGNYPKTVSLLKMLIEAYKSLIGLLTKKATQA
jgi:murein DD-endopeptidase MepM/ murein hydrolase activator NlpD